MKKYLIILIFSACTTTRQYKEQSQEDSTLKEQMKRNEADEAYTTEIISRIKSTGQITVDSSTVTEEIPIDVKLGLADAGTFIRKITRTKHAVFSPNKDTTVTKFTGGEKKKMETTENETSNLKLVVKKSFYEKTKPYFGYGGILMIVVGIILLILKYGKDL